MDSNAEKNEINQKISSLEKYIINPTEGLPEELFLFFSRNTPLVNVDLLIKNSMDQILLTWRNDKFYRGWHIPGGIVRYKETFEKRINFVAKNELNSSVKYNPVPIDINELFDQKNDERGHFISLLFECHLVSQLDPKKKNENIIPNHGEWKWHNSCPNNLLDVQECYRKFFRKSG